MKYQYINGMSARDYMSMEIPPERYVIPGLIGDGMSIIGGKPKIGKSMFSLNMALSMASGGSFLGQDIEMGMVGYIALEDNARTIRKRLNTMVKRVNQDALDNLIIFDKTEGDNKLDWLDNVLDANPEFRLIIIDTLYKFGLAKLGSYDVSYDSMDAIRCISQKYDVPIIIIDHLRKAEGASTVDLFAGSIGKTGAVDGLITLVDSRKPGVDGVLCAQGRDIQKTEIELSIDRDCLFWTLREEKLSKKEMMIQIMKANNPVALSLDEWSNKAGIDYAYTKALIGRLCENGVAVRVDRGLYRFNG